ncbi:MAG: hypothetical protein H6635_10965 [Anaerolineales bacterium]|nr:hypothetical protein [Anaerolineales bacterium]
MYKLSNYYKTQDVWTLFLISAFPLHVWTLLLGFQDISWLAERTNFFDALSVISYGLVFALFESLLLLVVVLLLGLLISTKWGRSLRVGMLGMMVTCLSLISMISQLYYLMGWSFSEQVIEFLTQTNHPLWWVYGVSLAAIFVLFAPSVYILFSKKLLSIWEAIADRLSLLMIMYLLFDLFAVCIVIYRNVSGA